MFFDLLFKGLFLSTIKSSMKAKLIFLILVNSVFYSNAQIDKKAQSILNTVSVKYKTLKSIKAIFSIIIENEQDKSKDVQTGTLYLKGSKYKLQIAGQEIISDGVTRWTYVKDANEIQVDNQKNNNNSISPTTIFTIYEKGWQSKYSGEVKVNKVTYQQIELVPTDGNSKNVFKVKLTINKADKTISSAKIYDKNGAIQTISVEKFIPDGGNIESLYVFNKNNYPGSEIVDLR